MLAILSDVDRNGLAGIWFSELEVEVTNGSSGGSHVTLSNVEHAVFNAGKRLCFLEYLEES